jgi:hypothetical protein
MRYIRSPQVPFGLGWRGPNELATALLQGSYSGSGIRASSEGAQASAKPLGRDVDCF